MSSSTPSVRAPGYLWIDAEFSCLDLEEAEILQVALMATDASLNRLAPAEKDLVLFIQRKDDRGVSPWVKENIPHILRGCTGPKALSLSDAEVRMCRYIDEVIGPIREKAEERPLIAGNSVHNDWLLLRRFFPGVLRRAHYRLLDVSTIKTLWTDFFQREVPDKKDSNFVRTWFPGAALQEGMAEHDAYFDIQASVAELAYYRAHLSVSATLNASTV